MALQVTDRARAKLSDTSIEPKLALCIEGLDYCFTSISVNELIRYGDEGLEYGDPVVYGGTRPIGNQKQYISTQGTSNTIRQQLEPERGAVSSVTTLTVRLIDKNNEISRLISPGFELEEPLGQKAFIYLGFGDTAFPEDYVNIHAGLISDIKAGGGYVDITVSSPEEQKRQEIFIKVESKLTAAITAGATSLSFEPLILDQEFLLPADDLTTYVRIDDEIIGYTNVVGNTLSGLTRGNFVNAGGSLASPHPIDSTIETIYVLQGHPLELALKVMLSGGPNSYDSAIEISSFNFVETTHVDNVIYFPNLDIFAKNGVVAGDTVTITGALNGANNNTFNVLQVVKVDTGSYLLLDGLLVDEIASNAVASFQSKYNVLGEGLGMLPRDVDILQHEALLNGFLASAPDLRIFLKDTEQGKELIEKEFYLPTSSYSLPRNGKASVGTHLPPIPGEDILTLDASNIIKPSQMRLRRSIGKNFYNQILYKYDQLITEDRFVGGVFGIDEDSITQIGKKQTLVIESRGLRTDLQAGSATTSTINRLLERYRRGAEYFEDVQVDFGIGSQIEPGDIVAIDFTDLKVVNTKGANRDKPGKLFEVVNKDLNITTGRVRLDLIDTNFDGTDRFALISPSSVIKAGLSTSQFIIEASYGALKYGPNEFQKWSDIVGCGVKIRTADFVTEADTFLVEANSNTLRVSPALPFTPTAGMILELSHYNNQIDRVKVLYAFLTDDSNPFPSDGGQIYVYA